jgi:hypothetical protein
MPRQVQRTCLPVQVDRARALQPRVASECGEGSTAEPFGAGGGACGGRAGAAGLRGCAAASATFDDARPDPTHFVSWWTICARRVWPPAPPVSLAAPRVVVRPRVASLLAGRLALPGGKLRVRGISFDIASAGDRIRRPAAARSGRHDRAPSFLLAAPGAHVRARSTDVPGFKLRKRIREPSGRDHSDRSDRGMTFERPCSSRAVTDHSGLRRLRARLKIGHALSFSGEVLALRWGRSPMSRHARGFSGEGLRVEMRSEPDVSSCPRLFGGGAPR